jgi:hypothetical protein
MPRSLIEPSRAPRPQHADEPSNEVRRTRQHKSNGSIEAKCLHSGREEVLESVGREMHVLHEHEEPDFAVGGGFLEAGACASLRFGADGVALNAGVGEFALLGAEPAGVQGVVR